jgi:hypothetical protein
MAKKQPGHGKQHVVAKHPAPHKPAKQSHGGGKGVSGKHSGTHKHKSTPAKHHPAKQKRTLAIGEEVGCCAAEAAAASLRLAGHPVSDQDVLDLYWHTAADADAGASIWETLEAAREFGLAGVRPVSFRETPRLRPGIIVGYTLPGGAHTAVVDGGWVLSWGERHPARLHFRTGVEEAWEITWQ